ncbi:hypothetical protein JK358_28520 [Nocardia sp. 2]|uniref:PE-PPE domain-containing protein n=1 Tax=Nocardia acididurans TaxID=2802282 RepID=A0ABS1MCH2_9NOCA|nr:hypothetical protein [Nocardia acididurans]MBL1078358.1 hypothetical protein [Nocardia acididurans]
MFHAEADVPAAGLGQPVIDVLILGASWATAQHPVVDAFTGALDPARFSPRVLSYSAPGGGRSALLDELRRGSGPVVLAGYAQGAAIVGDLAAAASADPRWRARIAGCALISDPLRPAGVAIGADPGGYGMLGERRIDGVPAYWSAAHGDLTTALCADSALRSIAEVCEYADLASVEEMVDWGRRMVDADIRDQLRCYPFGLRSWNARGAELSRLSAYLFTRQYVDEYLVEGGAVSLAEVLNRELTIC